MAVWSTQRVKWNYVQYLLVASGYLITGEVGQLDMGDRQAALGGKQRKQTPHNRMENAN